jgi:hypothetical protein
MICKVFTLGIKLIAPKHFRFHQSPQPKWGVLRALNYVVLTTFIGSITYVVFNYRRTININHQNDSASPLTSMFFPIMVLWTMCLAYFFGFFGISFLDTEAISESPSTFGLSDLQRQADAARDAEDEKALKKPKTSQKAKIIVDTPKATAHVPRNDTVICSDKLSTSSDAACKISAEQAQLEAGDIDEVPFETLSDDEVFDYLLNGSLKDYQLEKRLGDYERAVCLRRRLYEHLLDKKLDLIPYAGYDYNKVGEMLLCSV